jgi:hypothetical protein
MVIIRILGGLGNQMFQYAAGRALSRSVEQPLLLDLRGFEGYALHQGFELGRIFATPMNAASAGDVIKMLGWRAPDLVRKVLKRTQSSVLRGEHLAIEPHFKYWDGVRTGGAPRYLMGYWQSEMYFKDYAETIRSDFRFRTPLDNTSCEIEKRILTTDAISLHVRRGDYLTHAATAKILSACSLDYYNAAMNYISERVRTPHFFVFSDDMEWVKSNLSIPFNKTYVEHNQGAASYRDMQLMHKCRHHVIANSSFSWWGAWLNPSPEKLVIAPKAWFCDGRDDTDLIPDGWVRL